MKRLLPALLLACSTPAPTPPADDPAQVLSVEGRLGGDPALYAARGAPPAAPGWDGPWTVSIRARDPHDPGATALAQGLGTTVQPWQGGLPPTTRGELAVLWLTPADGAPAFAPPGPGAPRGQGMVVAALAPGDASWAQAQAERLPWAGLGVLDAAAATGLWALPAIAAEQPTIAGLSLARTLSDRFDLSYTAPAEPPSTIPGLAEHLRPAPAWGQPEPRARASAALDDPDPRLADDPEVAVRLALASSTRDSALLASLARDPEPLVRARAADRLVDVPLLTTLSADPSSVVRLVAVHALALRAQAGETAAGPALAAVAQASPQAYERWKAAWGLGFVPGQAPLLATLLADPDVDVRREAATALGRLGDPAGREPLEAALADPDSFVRITVAEALGELGDPLAIPALRAAMDDPARLVVNAAARSLGRLGFRAGASPYRPPSPPDDHDALAALLSSPDPTTRKDGSKFAAGQPEAPALLGPLLADPDPEVRKAAAAALGWSPDAAPLLAPLLADPDLDVVVTATEALRRVGGFDPQALVPLLDHPDAELRLRATEALASLGPHPALEPMGSDPDERIRAAWARAYPERVQPGDPSVLVRRAAAAAGPAAWIDDPSALVRLPADPPDPHAAPWAEGVIAREDDLLHERFSFHDRVPASHQALRPPVVREYGHPDRG